MTKTKITKKLVWDNTKYFSVLIALSFLRALSTYVFIVPNAFAPGGLGGISIIVYNALQGTHLEYLTKSLFDPGIFTFILNIPMLILAFITLNKRFAFNTLCVVGAYTGFIYMFGAIDFPQYIVNGDAGLSLVTAIFGGVMGGIGMGAMLRRNMSLGGTDIIGKLIYKHNPTAETQWWIFACDALIATASGILGLIGINKDLGANTILINVLSPIFYSFVTLFVTSQTAEILQNGLLSSIAFNIISDKADEIADEISEKLHRGTTISHAIGHYTGQEHKVLICIVSKKQINIVKSIIHKIDPQAFTYITKVREVAGKGFRSNDIEN